MSETLGAAQESLSLIETRLAGPDSFGAWAAHVAVVREGLDAACELVGALERIAQMKDYGAAMVAVQALVAARV